VRLSVHHFISIGKIINYKKADSLVANLAVVAFFGIAAFSLGLCIIADDASATAVTITGTNGDDDINLVGNGTNSITVTVNDGPEISYTGVTSLIVEGLNGDDTLTVDFTAGNPVPVGGLFYNGGSQSTVLGDALVVIESAGKHGVYTPDSLTYGDGVIDIDGSSIAIANLEPVIVTGFTEFTFVTPNSNDVLTVDSPAAGQNRVSGTSGGIAFEALTFSTVTHFKIDTATNDGPLGNPNDSVTFSSDLVATGLSTFTIDTGPGNDTVNAANVTSKGVTVFGGAGDDTLTGGDGPDRLEGGEGMDVLTGNAGQYNHLLGGPGIDYLYSSGNWDRIDGGEGQYDVLNFNDGAGDYSVGQFGSKLYLARSSGASALGGGVEMVQIGISAGTGGNFTIEDLTGLSVDSVGIRGRVGFGSTSTAALEGTLEITGSVSDDNIDVGESSFSNNHVGVSLGWGEVTFLGFPTATLEINGREGNDNIKVNATPALQGTAIVLNGGTGNDYLSADAVLNGGAGDDILVGGTGNNTINGNDGNDTIVGNGGSDTVDGGAGTDTILVPGTVGDNSIDIGLDGSGNLDVDINSTVTEYLSGGTSLENLRVEADASQDFIQFDLTAGLIALDTYVDGEDPTGIFPGQGDTMNIITSGSQPFCFHHGPESDAGVFMINATLPVSFDGIETLQIDSEEFLMPDTYEPNDTRTVGTVLGSLPWITLQDLTIHDMGNATSNEDWFRITAHDTGMLIINAIFSQRANPNQGDLDIEMWDAEGYHITPSGQGDSSDSNERIIIPVVGQQQYFLRVFSQDGEPNAYDLEIENFAAPVPDAVILDPMDDTGMSNSDNITSEDEARIFIEADLMEFAAAGIDILTPAEVTANEPGAAVEVTVNGLAVGTATPIAGTNDTLFLYTFEPGELSTTFIPAGGGGGLNFVKAAVRVYDGQVAQADGRSQLSEPLLVTLDTTPPFMVVGDPLTADDGLCPESDSGVSGSPHTFVDRVTNDTTPTFFGFADPGTVILGYVVTDDNGTPLNPDDDTLVQIGTAVADPVVGNSGDPGGWRLSSTVNVNDSDKLAPLWIDGVRLIRFIGRGVDGNLTDPEELQIFIDTRGPRVTEVFIKDAPAFDLFGIHSNGATPPVTSLMISVQDLPDRSTIDPNFQHPALDSSIAAWPGHYLLVGDDHGVISIASVIITNNPPIPGSPATSTLELEFAEPLPDDHFTLIISDSIMDPAGNKLDGETNAIEPQDTPIFPSGDGIPGGDYVARFIVNSILAPTNAPDLLESSDSGIFGDDNVTNKMQPALQGIGESFAEVRVYAMNVATSVEQLVGEGVVGSDDSEVSIGGLNGQGGLDNDGLGLWEVTVEPLIDGVYGITAEYEDEDGVVGRTAVLLIEIDTLSPQRPTLDLVTADDTGKSDVDNITTAPNPLSFTVTAELGSRVLIKAGETVIDDFTMPALSTTRTLSLTEGVHLLSAEAFDIAGNRSAQSEELNVTINRLGPVANINGPYTGNEGSPISLSSAGSSGGTGSSIVSYEWDLDFDGSYDDATGITTSHTWNDDGTYSIGLKVTNDHGDSDTATTTVTVNNVAPTVDAGPDDTINEGDTFTSSGSFTDPGSDTWTATVNYGDATGTLSLPLSGKTFSLSHTYSDNGTFTVTVIVNDDDGGSGSDTAIVTVNNVAPTATFSNDGPKDEGSVVTVSFSNQYDPGTSDTFTYSFDWENDGTYDIIDQVSASAMNTWNDNGSYTVKGRIKDNDGDYNEYTTVVTVNNVAPTATFGNDGPKNEGSIVTVLFSNQDDPGTSDTFTYSFDWENDGTYDIVDQLSASATHSWNDNGSFTVKGRIKDNDGDYNEYTTAVTVQNVEPLISPMDEKSTYANIPITIDDIEWTDPGSNDTHTVIIDWDDGNVDDLGTVVSPVTGQSHTYALFGLYSVTVKVTDDDGGFGIETFTIEVIKDTSPPEAIIRWNRDSREMEVLGVDDIDPDVDIAKILLSETITGMNIERSYQYTLLDNVGNSLVLKLTITTWPTSASGFHQLRATITSMVYNGGSPIVPARNLYDVIYSEDSVSGELTYVRTLVLSLGDFRFLTQWSLSGNKTQVYEWIGSDPVTISLKDGLIVVDIKTESGDLHYYL